MRKTVYLLSLVLLVSLSFGAAGEVFKVDFGGNGDDNVRAVKLKRDMISLDGDVIKMSAQNFFEAAWVFKRNGTYYFAYSSTPRAGMGFDYMMSKKPTDGFTYAGVTSDQPPLNNNNHHAALFEFKGKWYQAYHNRIVAQEAGIPTGFRRNIAIDTFDFNEDGTIQKMKFSCDGINQVGLLNPYERVEAETFNSQRGIETEQCEVGGMNLCAIENGDWIKLRGVDCAERGLRGFTASLACEGKGGKIEVRIGSPEGKLLGSCDVSDTGGLQSWKEFSCGVAEMKGAIELCLLFKGEKGALFNFDWWKFTKN